MSLIVGLICFPVYLNSDSLKLTFTFSALAATISNVVVAVDSGS